MSEAAIIGRWRSTPGLFWMRRRILRLRRFNWRWTLAFTRKPPGGRTVEGVKYLDCSPKPGGFRVSRSRSASNYAWLRTSAAGPKFFGIGVTQLVDARHWVLVRLDQMGGMRGGPPLLHPAPTLQIVMH